MKRAGMWGSMVLAAPLAAAADPVAVVASGAGGRGADAAAVARVAEAVGGDARHGAALRERLAGAFGRFAPREDVLAAARSEAAQGWDAYFRSGPRSARRRLSEAVTAMEAAPDALALRDDNRAAYLRAVGMLARIDLEGRQTVEADGWMRRALRLDPAWTPPTTDFPPPVQQLAARLRGADANASGDARLVVRLPREGCGVTVDGAAQAGTAREQTVTVRAGAHRVAADCGAPSRVRELTVRAGEAAEVSIDPALDARLQLTGDAALSYASEAEESSLAALDASALGRAAGAAQVILVGATRARVYDVAGARVIGEVELARGDFATALRAAREGRSATPTAPTPAPPPAAVAARGPGAGPWVLVGVGAALAIGGGVFWALRASAYGDLVAQCPLDADGAPACADATRLDAARGLRVDANLWQGVAVGAWAAGGVAITAGLLWYALGRGGERVTVAASPRGASVTLRW